MTEQRACYFAAINMAHPDGSEPIWEPGCVVEGQPHDPIDIRVKAMELAIWYCASSIRDPLELAPRIEAYLLGPKSEAA